MKPIFIDDGEDYKVSSVNFQGELLMCLTIDRDGRSEVIWNELVSPWDDDAINLEGAIYWEGRYKPLYDSIEELIVKYNDDMNNLRNKIVDSLMGTEYVPPNLITKYRELNYELKGVYATFDVIKELNRY